MVEQRFDSFDGPNINFKTVIMRQIEVNSEGWVSLLNEIQNNFSDGSLISHEYLKKKFTLENLSYEDYSSVNDFVNAIQQQQFAYMTLIDTLRWNLLEDRQMYLKNVRGDGYVILQPKEQTQYGYNEFIKTVNKAIKEADLIMSNVASVPFEQQAIDNTIRAKCSMLKQMLKSIK